MDKQLEQRIRDRAYELWMQHGSLPGRDEEYWYQAESEILGEAGASSDDRLDLGVNSSGEASSAPFLAEDDGTAPVETSAAPLGMTSQTLDEVLPEAVGGAAEVPKARRRRSAAVTAESAVPAAAAPKRGRKPRTP
jgi:hypothetical protein